MPAGPPRVLKIIVAYDGTRYVGWQRQRNGVSIQALLEDALTPLAHRCPVRVAGAGRTDAGVHARAQVASCSLSTTLDVDTIQRALNSRLPEDIRVSSVSEAEPGFHARFSAWRKTYSYNILNAAVVVPFLRHFVWHVPQPLDLVGMQAALLSVCGTHDFRAFQASGAKVSTTVRTVWEASILAQSPPRLAGPHGPPLTPDPASGRLLALRFTGDGFLRHMVRNLVGTVVEIGLGRRDPPHLADALAGGDRRWAGATAPALGLVLVSVDYRQGESAQA